MQARHREELDRENERNKNAQQHLERTHAARERAHKQRTRGLEEQINTLKDQLNKEMQQKQSFINRTSLKNDEMRDIRHKLASSLTEVSKNAEFNVLERESRKLDETADSHHSFSGRSSFTSSTPFQRRAKSSSPLARMSPDRYNNNYVLPPSSDAGFTTATHHATPIMSDKKSSYVSPLRKTRKPLHS